jgi:hypothetical protein
LSCTFLYFPSDCRIALWDPQSGCSDIFMDLLHPCVEIPCWYTTKGRNRYSCVQNEDGNFPTTPTSGVSSTNFRSPLTTTAGIQYSQLLPLSACLFICFSSFTSNSMICSAEKRC